MPQQTKIFRVFISSTFTDMQEERGILQKKVFPRLEKFCEENGARFQAVDLRWGVNEESQLNQKTLEICLNEIARCQKISPKPNFLILLGDKYGWQPVPTRIPEDEMNKILAVTGNKETLERWYRLDTNALHPEYVLQPRGKELADYAAWDKIEKELQTSLREAVDKASFRPEQREKYFTSATHQEIMSGALNPVNVKEKPEDHVFAMIREIPGLPADGSAVGFVDLTNGQPDKYSRKHLNHLKDQLKAKIGDHCIHYNAKWENNHSKMNDPEAFENTLFAFLKEIISEQLKEVISPDEIDQEIRLHTEFKTKLTEHFCGREEILQILKKYLDNITEKRIMALTGDSGSGKSSVLAKAIREVEASQKNAAMVYRFIGTSSRSSNIISLLQSVCGQIAREYGTTLEALAGEGRDKALYDLNGLSEILKKCLALGTAEKPVMLFLDALDQLTDSDNARSLFWLSRELPEHARMVVSSLSELKPQLNHHYTEELPVLPVEDASKILERWFNSVGRRLTAEQQKDVLDKFSKTGLPIYLKLAFERARKWNSYTTGFTLQEDVKGIINNYIDLLEEEHTKAFVKDVICFMLCGRYQGLAENEILEVLVFDPEDKKAFISRTHPDYRKELEDMTRIPIVYWSRLYIDLEPYLTERDADGVPIITFFHRQFNEVLRERYELVDEVVEN